MYAAIHDIPQKQKKVIEVVSQIQASPKTKLVLPIFVFSLIHQLVLFTLVFAVSLVNIDQIVSCMPHVVD